MWLFLLATFATKNVNWIQALDGSFCWLDESFCWLVLALVCSAPLIRCQESGKGFLEGGLEGQAGNKVTLENYRAIEAAYAKEFLRAPDNSQNPLNPITYLIQVSHWSFEFLMYVRCQWKPHYFAKPEGFHLFAEVVLVWNLDGSSLGA